MRGPFLPIYGSGAIMMLVVSQPFQHNILLVYLSGCVGATALEYITGVAMESLFQIRYWDYSNKRFNFQGHICLSSTVTWGFFTVAMTRVVHRPVEALMYEIPPHLLNISTIILTVFIVADFTLSFRAALDIRDLLFKMEKAKTELMHMQKRLDVIIAVASEGISNSTDGISTRFADLKNSIAEKLEGIKGLAQSKPSAYLESVKEEVIELRDRYMKIVYSNEYWSSLKDFFRRDMLRSNPDMHSDRFKDDLEELRQEADKWQDEENSEE
jgi:uncharacterized membrane protein